MITKFDSSPVGEPAHIYNLGNLDGLLIVKGGDIYQRLEHPSY